MTGFVPDDFVVPESRRRRGSPLTADFERFDALLARCGAPIAATPHADAADELDAACGDRSDGAAWPARLVLLAQRARSARPGQSGGTDWTVRRRRTSPPLSRCVRSSSTRLQPCQRIASIGQDGSPSWLVRARQVLSPLTATPSQARSSCSTHTAKCQRPPTIALPPTSPSASGTRLDSGESPVGCDRVGSQDVTSTHSGHRSCCRRTSSEATAPQSTRTRAGPLIGATMTGAIDEDRLWPKCRSRASDSCEHTKRYAVDGRNSRVRGDECTPNR